MRTEGSDVSDVSAAVSAVIAHGRRGGEFSGREAVWVAYEVTIPQETFVIVVEYTSNNEERPLESHTTDSVTIQAPDASPFCTPLVL